MNRELHSDIKIYKAKLIRYKFSEYLNSEDFRLILLENDYDQLFKLALNESDGFINERKLNAILNMLNHLLFNWICSIPDSDEYIAYHKHFKKIISIITIDFYKWKKSNIDMSELLFSISNIKIIKSEDVKEIEEKINQITLDNNQVIENNIKININKKNKNSDESVEYGILTALEEDEMEKILQLFVQEYEVSETKNYIEFGHLKSNPKKKIVYASQHNTGLVDASILATEILTRFKPKYLIMTGVLGGKPEETKIGDVVIATKVFEINKGKLTDTGFKKETSSTSITSIGIKKINRKKKEIEQYIDSQDETRNSNVKLHFGPIASVSQVIDVVGFFEEKITEIDRKAIALEMESFAIVRACELINDGKTIPIIIKSVMDNTQDKTDNAKSYASWTSDRTLEYILKEELI